jgi:hypothetical protein
MVRYRSRKRDRRPVRVGWGGGGHCHGPTGVVGTLAPGAGVGEGVCVRKSTVGVHDSRVNRLMVEGRYSRFGEGASGKRT